MLEMENTPIPSSIESERCLFCVTPLAPKFTVGNITKLNGKTADCDYDKGLPSLTSEESYVDKQLQVIFVLRNILHIPEKKVCRFLKQFGGDLVPELWFQICSSCWKNVQQYYETLKEISRLERRLTRISNQFKGQIHNTKEVGGGKGIKNIWEEIRTAALKDFQEAPSPATAEVPKTNPVAPPEDQACRQLRSFEKLDLDSQSEPPASPHCPSSTGNCSPGRISPDLDEDAGENVDNEHQSDFEPSGNESEASSNSNYSSQSDSELDNFKPPKGNSSLSSPAKRKRGPHRKNRSDAPRPKANCPYSNRYTVFYKNLSSGRALCFKCSLCSAILRHKAKIIEHLKLHESGEGSNCPTCGWLVVRLKDHSAKFHPKETPERYIFSCSKCPAQYNSKTELRKHLELHESSSEDKSICDVCGWLTRKRVMGRHKVDHHGKDSEEKNKETNTHLKRVVNLDIPYYCDHCQMIYTSMGQLQKHFTTSHADKEGFIICKEEGCSENFESSQLLKFHMEKAHPDQNPPQVPEEEEEEVQGEQKCTHCETVFTSKLTLDYHIAEKHKDVLLTCTTCNIKFPSYYFYRKHMETTRIHATTKGFSCELCGKSYWSDRRLQYHRRQAHFAELGLNPIQCTECGLILCESGALKTHIKLVHQQREKNFTCQFCGRAFSIPRLLATHISRFHEGPLAASELPEGKHFRVDIGANEEKVWLCEFCPVKFSAMHHVRKHLFTVHYYELKYFCEGCGRRFCAAIGLHNHRKSCVELKEGGTPGEKFDCSFCSKTFQTSDKRHLHQRRFHKDGVASYLCPACGKGFKKAARLEVHQQTCGGGLDAFEQNAY